MDAINREIRYQMQKLLELSDRNAARYDRMIELLDSCRATGGAPSSPSTSAGSDVCGVAEVPMPASPNPIVEVPTPASSDSDAKPVTIDVDGPAAPAWTTRSTGDTTRNTTESSSAPAPPTAPTVHMATVEIVSVLVAPAATDGNPDGQGISGVTSTPATCSTVCLPRHPEATPVMVASLLQDPTEYVLQGSSSSVSTVKETPGVDPSASTGFITTTLVTCSTYWSHQQPVAAPELVASAPPTPSKYGLDTNNISVAAVRPALSGVLSVLAPEVLSLQLYNNHELVEPSSDQYISSMVHRPRPWPSFIADHASGDETRPLPWPSFGKVNGYEFLSYAVQKVSQCYSSDSSRTESCTVIGFQISAFCGNLFTSIGYIITSDSCHSCEWIKCFSEVLLFLEYSRSASNFEQSAHVYHTTLACLFCTIFGFQWLDMVRSLELKLWSNGSRSITLLAVPLVSGNFASLSCEYLGVDTIDGLGSWIFVGSSVAVSQESSVQISTDHLIAREIAFGVLSTLVWHLLDFLCRSDVSDASYWPGYFDTGRQEKLVITAASRGSHWLVPCEWGPAISSSLSALCDQWFMSPWDSGQQADSSYDQSSCANQDTSCFPRHFITGGQRQDFVACPILQLFLSGFLPSFHPLVMFELQLARSGNHWVLHSCNSGQHAPSRNSGQQLSGAFQNAAYWPANFVTLGQMQVTKDFTQRKSSGLDTMDWHILELLSSALATICWAYFQLLVHYLNNYQLTILVTAAGHRMLLARCQNGEKNSHMLLLLPWVLEQKEPSIAFQFQESSCRPDWCRGNQSIWARVCPYYSLKFNLLADTWSSRLLRVRSVCAAVHAFVLPDKQHSPSWQRALAAIGRDALLFLFHSVAHCSVTSSMLSDLGLSIRAICEVWLLNHPESMPLQIRWPTSVHASFITNELSHEENLSCYFLCWYHGRTALFLFLASDRQLIFQEGGYAMIPSICYVTQGSYSDFIAPLDSNGLKNQDDDNGFITKRQYRVLVQHIEVPWSADRSKWCQWFFTGYYQAPFHGGRYVVAMTTFKQVLADHKYYLDFDNINDRQLQWDPGGFAVISAWGQAEFQGGRGVRDPSCTSSWAGHGPSSWAWPTYQQPVKRYKYARHGNKESIQMDQDGTGSLSRPPCFSAPPSLLLCFPILAEILVSEYLYR